VSAPRHNALQPGPEWVLAALGSNLGDSPAILRAVIERLRTIVPPPLIVSSFRWTEPVDCPPGSPPFLNAAVAFAPPPGETPESLLAKFKQLERDFGRRPKRVANEPRPLDLDLIAFGRQTRQSTELTLPHPRAASRRFVLEPLNEIAPDFVLPGQTQTVSQLLAALEI